MMVPKSPSRLANRHPMRTPPVAEPDPLNRSKKPYGFVCPKCLRPLVITTTRRAAPGIVKRYRVCQTPRCKYVMVTEERKRHPVPTPA